MIVLEILKIIGIVLACIVGLVLLLVLLVLLAPIAYKLSGNGANADIEAEGKASWIFGLFSASAAYRDKNLFYRISVIGIGLKEGNLKELTAKKKQETEVEGQAGEALPDKEAEQKEETAEPTKEEKKAEKKAEKETSKEEKAIAKAKEKQKTEDKEEKEEKEDLTDRIDHFFDELSEKNNQLTAKIEQAETILTSKVTARAWKKVKEELFNILNHIKPKKIAGNLNFGLEDPSNTAIIYGTIDILAQAISAGKLIITPEFYQPGISLDMSIHGRIFLGYIVLCALRIILNKDVRRVIRVIRRVV